MRGWLLATVAVVGLTVSAQEARNSSSLERAFPPNGSLKMDLVAGDYEITGSPEARLRIDWSVREAAALPKVRVRAEGRDGELRITTDGPSNKGLKFRIQVPGQSHLYVRMSAGDLKIEDVRGNKDVELRAGDLKIDVGRATDYKKVDASLWAGDINASAFRISKDGLFRSFDWNGPGAYRLHAHLMAGDLYLYEKAASR
jgi:hypothetical protein